MEDTEIRGKNANEEIVGLNGMEQARERAGAEKGMEGRTNLRHLRRNNKAKESMVKYTKR